MQVAVKHSLTKVVFCKANREVCTSKARKLSDRPSCVFPIALHLSGLLANRCFEISTIVGARDISSNTQRSLGCDFLVLLRTVIFLQYEKCRMPDFGIPEMAEPSSPRVAASMKSSALFELKSN